MSHEEKDGIDRRGALECMIWAGTGVLWTMAAGVPHSSLLGISEANAQATRGFTIPQISDRIGLIAELGELWAKTAEAISKLGDSVAHLVTLGVQGHDAA